MKFSQRVKNVIPVVTRSPVALANLSSKVWIQSFSWTINVKLSPGGTLLVTPFSFSRHFNVE
jgi:hypothetical protein